MTGPYRVGNHNARHVYRGDREIAVAFTEDDGRLIAFALNAHHAALDRAEAELATREREEARRAAEGQDAFRKELQKQLRRHGAVI